MTHPTAEQKKRRSPYITHSSITLADLPFYAYHGVLPDERRDGAPYTLSVTLSFSAEVAMHSDDVADTIDYASVYALLTREMAEPSDLIEHVVGRILRALGDTFPSLTQATCSLTKVKPPIPGFDGACATFTADAVYRSEDEAEV